MEEARFRDVSYDHSNTVFNAYFGMTKDELEKRVECILNEKGVIFMDDLIGLKDLTEADEYDWNRDISEFEEKLGITRDHALLPWVEVKSEWVEVKSE